MKEVAVIVDSVAMIPPEVAEKYDISVVPSHVVMDGKDYLETEIDREQVYARLRSKENLPSTSAASPGEVLESFKRASQQAKSILFISLSSGLSAIYSSATDAKKLAQQQLPDTTIEVLDSLTVAGAEMLIAIEAAKAANEGKSLPEVTEVATKIKQRVASFALRESLFHFDRSGRTGKATDWAKSAIPTVTALEISAASGGVVKPLLRERSVTKAIEATFNLVEERIKGGRLRAAVTHTNVPDKAKELKKRLLSRFKPAEEVYIGEAMPFVGVVNGEGMFEVGFYAEA
jgi:DegV family protein with EDD domain